MLGRARRSGRRRERRCVTSRLLVVKALEAADAVPEGRLTPLVTSDLMRTSLSTSLSTRVMIVSGSACLVKLLAPRVFAVARRRRCRSASRCARRARPHCLLSVSRPSVAVAAAQRLQMERETALCNALKQEINYRQCTAITRYGSLGCRCRVASLVVCCASVLLASAPKTVITVARI